MNTGEMLITLGAMTLLTVIILNLNRALCTTDECLNKSRFRLEKMALATSLIEEISQYPFDETSWDSVKIEKVPSDFTVSTSLGPDAGESSVTLYDDVDDFHKYCKIDTTQQNIYKIECEVCYVTESSPDVAVSSRTYFKKINVIVSDLTGGDTTDVNYVHGFWYFN